MYYQHNSILKMLLPNAQKYNNVRNVFLESKYHFPPEFIHKVVQRQKEKSVRCSLVFTTQDGYHTLWRFRAICSQSNRFGIEYRNPLNKQILDTLDTWESRKNEIRTDIVKFVLVFVKLRLILEMKRKFLSSFIWAI